MEERYLSDPCHQCDVSYTLFCRMYVDKLAQNSTHPPKVKKTLFTVIQEWPWLGVVSAAAGPEVGRGDSRVDKEGGGGGREGGGGGGEYSTPFPQFIFPSSSYISSLPLLTPTSISTGMCCPLHHWLSHCVGGRYRGKILTRPVTATWRYYVYLVERGRSGLKSA